MNAVLSRRKRIWTSKLEAVEKREAGFAAKEEE